MRSGHRRAISVTCLLLAATCGWAADSETLETVTVVGVAPLPHAGVPLELIPANVQTFSSGALERLHALDLSQQLNRAAGSVYINEAQSNPLQPDLQFRGFTASPLLGLPQGLAVFLDGVRINEPFGDTVSWALIPRSALAQATLTPGASPLFGANALGGALALQTADGSTHPGLRLEASHGAHSRTLVEGAYGVDPAGGWSYIAAGSWFDETGWRDFSPSQAAQLFTKARYDGRRGHVAFSAAGAATDLIGNGPAPVQLLQQDRTAIFTRPDRTENDLQMIQMNAAYELAPDMSFSAAAHYRRSDVDTLNGDDSPFEECDAAPGLLCEADGDPVLDQSGSPVALSPLVTGGSLNRSNTRQRSEGVSLQFDSQREVKGRRNYLTTGISAHRSRSRFASSTELGSLDESRQAIGSGVFSADAFTDLDATTHSYAAYVTDTLELTPAVAVNFAGRYDRVSVELRDHLGDALTGDHHYARFNPAVGVTWRVAETAQLYARAGEASRAPTPVELTCADPEDPCRLPNAFLSDPPLEQVVSRTFEAGARGGRERLRWTLGVFQATNRDDILFISAGALTNEGYFDNVGRTRRRGVELMLSGEWGERLSWFANYTLQQATFEEDFVVAAAHNPAAQDGEIAVNAGDHIPGAPERLLKLGADLDLGRWSLGADLNYASGQYLRGDEGNLLAPIGGYMVLNLRTAFQLNENVSVFAVLDNALDREYATFGVLGEPDEVLGEDYDDPRFVSPGAPRALWLGVRVKL